MKKIFLDANILIDLLDASSRDHAAAVGCLRIIRKHFGRPVVSPITFIIVDFVLGKFAKNRQWHRKQMQLTFSEMEITALQPSFIARVSETHFTDLEDGLQYQCARHAKAKIILTKDLGDYPASDIPAIHPQDFVARYQQLFRR
jgi:predicted nucleic acid-binding protein